MSKFPLLMALYNQFPMQRAELPYIDSKQEISVSSLGSCVKYGDLTPLKAAYVCENFIQQEIAIGLSKFFVY